MRVLVDWPDPAAPRGVLAGALPADVGPGRFARFDLSTTNLPRSRDFYGQLFGWRLTLVEGTDQALESASIRGWRSRRHGSRNR